MPIISALIGWLTNADAKAARSGVKSQAFSLTKVLIPTGALVTALVSWLMTLIGNRSFSDWQVTSLILGVLAFAAVVMAADVYARAHAAAGKAVAEGLTAATAARQGILRFAHPLFGVARVMPGTGRTEVPVHVHAMQLTGADAYRCFITPFDAADGTACWIEDDQLELALADTAEQMAVDHARQFAHH